MKARVINENGRKKAFIGAIVGAMAGIAGGIISAKKKKKAEEAAFKQQQAEQTLQEGNTQAAAMSSSYANQDYVDQYNKKFTLKAGGKVKSSQIKDTRIKRSKQFAMGGRKKAATGGMFSGIADAFKGDNLKGTINGIAGGVSNAVNVANGNPSSNIITPTGLLDTGNTLANRAIANQATSRRYRSKLGSGRKQYMGGGIGSAAGGVGSLVGSLFQSSKAPKQIKKAAGFSFDAPKTGLVANSYQLDANGQPITAVNADGTVIDPTMQTNSIYADRLPTAKLGKRKARAI